ncbi:PREDICTED: uncharacterized protein LOC104755163 [Camelina sativa]|uniref:Uncharacterized protein LOC104755163 n=1 Tax=Camelina sativa TaxID=90675 RepID=A0ABM0WT70_CAMSA|nr:PREDICTED: uncharacterized protein LOC104755163 [Camelina sativa]
MRELSGSNGLAWRRLVFFASIGLQFVLGLSGDSKDTKAGVKTESHSSSSKTGTKVILVLFGFVAVAAFSFFLYKLWQKKKRDEQYARLLKLFEEDDELEVELGLRD